MKYVWCIGIIVVDTMTDQHTADRRADTISAVRFETTPVVEPGVTTAYMDDGPRKHVILDVEDTLDDHDILPSGRLAEWTMVDDGTFQLTVRLEFSNGLDRTQATQFANDVEEAITESLDFFGIGPDAVQAIYEPE